MKSGARTSWKQAALLLAFGAMVAFLAIEISVRIATHSLFHWGSVEGQDGIITDPRLGRIIAKIGQARHPTKGFSVSTAEHGTRRNGETQPRSERPLILAVGDSFAFGDGVNDEDTWPAVLERLTGGTVINAAMIGFGVDQMVLRAEQLVDVYSPDLIVVAFIPHDVLRCEMSYWSGFSKPYFEIDSAGLRLHLAEVPTQSTLSGVKRLLSNSRALEVLFPEFLHFQGPRKLLAHQRGREVACLLMQRLRVLSDAHHVPIVVLAHPQEVTSQTEDREIKSGVLACAEAQGLLVLDLFPAIEPLPLEERQRLFDRHLAVEGCRLVGSELARFLAENGLIPARAPDEPAAP